MPQLLTITALRKQLFPVADRVIKTGVSVKFTKDSHVLKLSVEKKPNKLANLRKHNIIVGNPEDLVNFKVWEWNEPENIE